MAGTAWQPYADGARAEALREALDQTVAELLRAYGSDDASLEAGLGGHAALALVHAYVAIARDDDALAERAMAHLDTAIDRLGTVVSVPALHGGFVGVAFAVEHLSGRLFDSDDDPNEDIDARLIEAMRVAPWPGDYDLVSGLVGIGAYALERAPRPAAVELLGEILARLRELADIDDSGASWHTRPELMMPWRRELAPAGLRDVGLAHGVAGPVALLAGMAGIDALAGEARALLEPAVTWILQQEVPGDPPRFAGERIEGTPLRPTRLGWCYGDPGVAIALLGAARALERPDLHETACNIGDRFARASIDDAAVRDAPFCHGASGLAHILGRFAQLSGQPARYAAAAERWLARALGFRQPDTPIGFATNLREDDDRVRWEARPGLIGGAGGVALTLLSALEPLEPDWDRALLVHTGSA